jgi:hypothetical protein
VNSYFYSGIPTFTREFLLLLGNSYFYSGIPTFTREFLLLLGNSYFYSGIPTFTQELDLSNAENFRENFRLNWGLVFRREFLSETAILGALIKAYHRVVFWPSRKKLKGEKTQNYRK